jgi:hypothetical protein
MIKHTGRQIMLPAAVATAGVMMFTPRKRTFSGNGSASALFNHMEDERRCQA